MVQCCAGAQCCAAFSLTVLNLNQQALLLCCVLRCALQAELPMAAMAAHGALMIVAFAVMLPSGLLVVRHKWLFIDQEHVSCQLAQCVAVTREATKLNGVGVSGIESGTMTEHRVIASD